MIDVLKRLQELDANNSNVIKESTVEECGPMGMMSPTQPKTPATINITADSGEELGSMLSAIMKLAGVNKVEPDHLGKEHDPSIMTATPTLGIPATDGEVMRGVLDKMNPEIEDEGAIGGALGAAGGAMLGGPIGAAIGGGLGGSMEEEEVADEGWKGAAVGAGAGELAGAALGTAIMPGIGTVAGELAGGALGAAAGDDIGDRVSGDKKKDEAVDELADIKKLLGRGAKYDTTPSDPTDPPAFDGDEYADHANPPGAGRGRGLANHPNATLEARLMDEYKKFISEDRDDDDYFSGISRDVDAMSHGGDEYSPRHDPLARFGGAGGDADAAVHSLGDIVKKDEEPVVAHAYFDNDAVEKNLRRAKHEKLEKDENGNWYFPVRGKLASRETKHHLVYLQRFFGEPTHVEKAEEPAMDND